MSTVQDEYHFDSSILRSTKNSSFIENANIRQDEGNEFYPRPNSAVLQKSRGHEPIPASLLKQVLKPSTIIEPSDEGFLTQDQEDEDQVKITEVDDLESMKTQKRHRQYLVHQNTEFEASRVQKTVDRHMPVTSEFKLTGDDLVVNRPSQTARHARVDSSKSSSRSGRQQSSSLSSLRGKQTPSASKVAEQNIKKAINKVKLTIKGSSPKTFSSLSNNRQSIGLKSRPNQQLDCSAAKKRLENTIDGHKTKTLDRISKKIASLIKHSGDMKIGKPDRRDSKVSSRINSRESVRSSRVKIAPTSKQTTLLAQTINNSKPLLKETAKIKSKPRPAEETKRVINMSWHEKVATTKRQRTTIEEKLTISNYSIKNQTSASKEYQHTSSTQKFKYTSENPYLCKTTRSSASNSRLSSRGASISGAKIPSELTPRETPASLKKLLKQIHCENKESAIKEEPKARKKPPPKPIATPASPFVRLKPKASLFGMSTSQRLR